MADEEQAPSSRKRVAGTQINKDNPEPDDDGPEQEMGTFKKATEEVMATQRIVKVRRQQTSSAPSSNPFSVPDKNAGSGVNTDSAATTEAPPQPVETSDKEEDTKDESGGDKVVVGEPKESSSMPSEVEGKTKEGDAEEKERADEAGNNDKISKDDTEKKDGGESETKDGFSDEQRDADKISKDDTEKKDGGESEQKDADNKGHTSSATPLFSFKNLSSGQNAFTGLTGTGFSSTSFSFGSASKDGSSSGPLFGLKADGSSFPSFNLGTANNGSSATALATSAEAPKKFAMTEGPVETGEENEKAVFTADSALYEYLDGGWKERGKGELKLNVPVSGGESGERARLVMRTKGNYRLVLNASLYIDMSLKDMDKKGVIFACMNSIGESPSSLATFALKFKDTATREEFKDAVESHKTSKAPDVQLKTPENSPKAAEV
ncbi:unnamed protein product [Miscanthus lutarioriparius]|uniref:RanBD1 domain-containing protein n=1 Tax=Miscanthus lutarioriparius TaxID=422564 RepID=A0A811P5U6_9POAL|nr:unnamed protein product [Miscanthus lutarioriparius]